MIKLIQDVQPFAKGEVLTFGSKKDAQLVEKGLAVWVKMQDLDYRKK
jgi:hypothetical protein